MPSSWVSLSMLLFDKSRCSNLPKLERFSILLIELYDSTSVSSYERFWIFGSILPRFNLERVKDLRLRRMIYRWEKSLSIRSVSPLLHFSWGTMSMPSDWSGCLLPVIAQYASTFLSILDEGVLPHSWLMLCQDINGLVLSPPHSEAAAPDGGRYLARLEPQFSEL